MICALPALRSPRLSATTNRSIGLARGLTPQPATECSGTRYGSRADHPGRTRPLGLLPASSVAGRGPRRPCRSSAAARPRAHRPRQPAGRHRSRQQILAYQDQQHDSIGNRRQDTVSPPAGSSPAAPPLARSPAASSEARASGTRRRLPRPPLLIKWASAEPFSQAKRGRPDAAVRRQAVSRTGC